MVTDYKTDAPEDDRPEPVRRPPHPRLPSALVAQEVEEVVDGGLAALEEVRRLTAHGTAAPASR